MLEISLDPLEVTNHDLQWDCEVAMCLGKFCLIDFCSILFFLCFFYGHTQLCSIYMDYIDSKQSKLGFF